MTSRVPTLIVHGGAGADPHDGREELREGVAEAVRAGWDRLVAGGSSLDAVEAAVRALEDHPRFNAGRGSVLTSAETVEMDASIMEGDGLTNGAVACVTGLRHPITLARKILEAGRHSFFVGEGALAQAQALGVPLCDPAELVTARQKERLRTVQAGTVGAVALDRAGVVAAATSTGGTSGKAPGRVGDSPLIGCGTYAESTLGGVSCTGDGEAIIRVVLARRTLDILKSVDDPMLACRVAMDVLTEEGRGGGGLICVDWKGRLGWAHSTPLMPVGWASPALGLVVGF
ncbi:MAG TPA: isoaspartyl peptidase/L-asparaginase [Pseudomonadales bacterium]|nr:isoaspartyl peptidase/L-asparaginase [Pseudomonadales bacterium]